MNISAPAVESADAKSVTTTIAHAEPQNETHSEPHDEPHNETSSSSQEDAVIKCLSPRSPHECDNVSRPSLFAHEPKARRAVFEEYYGDKLHNMKFLDELKSDRLEGVYNLSFLLLAFALAYLFIRNVIETGFLAGPSAICVSTLLRDLKMLILFVLPLPLMFAISFCVVLLHARRLVGGAFVISLHVVALLIFFTVCTRALFQIRLNPLFGVGAGVVVVIVAMKMHSYVMTNLLLSKETEERRRRRRTSSTDKSMQRASRHVDSPERDKNNCGNSSSLKTSSSARSNRQPYPKNINLRNIAYFTVAPTLVYETGYPRTTAIRPSYISWYTIQACLCGIVQYILLMQFCIPIWKNSPPTDKLLWFSIKLGLPCFFMWLLLFWGYFHCVLNVIAEVTRFADRLFYMEWWNATDLNQFWRTWNIPVHEWCLRHMVVETVSRQWFRPRAAALSTFLLSALFHEYVCLVAFRMLRPYMFFGMMLQVPLIHWSMRLRGTRRGNFFMWIMLFLGQSWVPLLYCRDFLIANGTLMCHPF